MDARYSSIIKPIVESLMSAVRRVRATAVTAACRGTVWRCLGCDRGDVVASEPQMFADAKFPDVFDRILADAGIRTVLSGVRMPRMNSIMERWVQELRHELLDRTLICN